MSSSSTDGVVEEQPVTNWVRGVGAGQRDREEGSGAGAAPEVEEREARDGTHWGICGVQGDACTRRASVKEIHEVT